MRRGDSCAENQTRKNAKKRKGVKYSVALVTPTYDVGAMPMANLVCSCKSSNICVVVVRIRYQCFLLRANLRIDVKDILNTSSSCFPQYPKKFCQPIHFFFIGRLHCIPIHSINKQHPQQNTIIITKYETHNETGISRGRHPPIPRQNQTKICRNVTLQYVTHGTFSVQTST